jgi:diguanylate cyclase (GGDEF)-like protein
VEETTEEIRIKSARLNLVLIEIFLTILGLLLTVAVSLDIQRERDRFAEASLFLHGQLDTQINRNLVALHGLAAFVKATDVEDQETLAAYSRYILGRHSYIYMLQVAQAVPGSQLERFVSAQREHQGRADFKVKKFSQEGSKAWTPVDGASETYYPVVFMEPMLPENIELIGLDLGSMAFSQYPLQIARETGGSIASRPYRLLDRDLGYMLIQPVDTPDKQLFAILVTKASKLIPASAVTDGRISIGIYYQGGVFSKDPVWLLRQDGNTEGGWLADLFPRLSASFPLGGQEQPLTLSVEEQLDAGVLNWPVLFGIVAGSMLSVPVMLAYSRARHRDEMVRLKASNTLFYQANFDALTGLPNRQLFMNRLEQALAVAHRQGLMHAVLYLDLDGFKGINDYYGHNIGDKVLVRAAKIFSRCVREIDTVARLGGDEFVILLQDIDGRSGAEFVASKIRKAFQSSAPVVVDPGRAPPMLGTSIGIAVYPQDGTSITELLKVSDADMYKDKLARKLAAQQPKTVSDPGRGATGTRGIGTGPDHFR